jgi:cation transport ATPase
MTCAACAARVERTINRLDGVTASVNFATGVATVDASSDIDPDMVCEKIIHTGYGAEAVSELAPIDTAPEDRITADLFRRLVVALVLFFPLSDLSIMFATVPSTRITGWQVILVVLAAPVVMWSAAPLHRRAIAGLRSGATSMETLVSIGITAATLWSLVTLFARPAPPARHGVWAAILGADSIYLEVAGGVTVFVLAGRYFEAKARRRAGGALRALAELGAHRRAGRRDLPPGRRGGIRIGARGRGRHHRPCPRPGGRAAAGDGLRRAAGPRRPRHGRRA